MSEAEVTRLTPSTVTVRVGRRTVFVSGDAIVDRPEAPYFVSSASITAWQPPHEDVQADHDGYQREHVEHDDHLSPHPSLHYVRAASGAEPATRASSASSPSA